MTAAAPRTAVVLCLAEVASMTGTMAFPALQAGLQREWGLGGTEAGLVNGVFFAGYLLGVPLFVPATDRRDAREVYVAGALAAAAATLAFAGLAAGFASALLCRAACGAALAGTFMPGLKALGDRTAGRARLRASAFYTATYAVGVAASVFCIGQLAPLLGWRAAVAWSALGPLLAAGLVAAGLVASPPGPRPQAEAAPWRAVLANRAALGYVAAYVAHTWELFGFRSWLVALLAAAPPRAVSPTQLATVVLALGLPASLLGAELALRGPRRAIVGAYLTASAAVALAVGCCAWRAADWLPAATLAYGVTVAIDSAAIYGGVLGRAHAQDLGRTLALQTWAGFAAAAVAPLAFGAVLDAAGGRGVAWAAAFGTLAAPALIGAIIMALTPEASPGRTT